MSDMQVPELTGWPVEEDARQYLERHRILELLENLAAQVVFKRPGECYIGLNCLLHQLERRSHCENIPFCWNKKTNHCGRGPPNAIMLLRIKQPEINFRPYSSQLLNIFNIVHSHVSWASNSQLLVWADGPSHQMHDSGTYSQHCYPICSRSAVASYVIYRFVIEGVRLDILVKFDCSMSSLAKVFGFEW